MASCPRVLDVVDGRFVLCGAPVPCTQHGAPLFLPGRLDTTDPNRHLPPHQRSSCCTSTCTTSATLFDDEAAGS